MSVAATNETAAKFSLSGLASTCQECSGCAITQSDRRYAIVYPDFNLPHQFSKLCWQRVPGKSGGHCQDWHMSTRTDCFLTTGTSATAPKHAVEQPEKTRGRATGDDSRPPPARAPLRALLSSCELYCAPPRVLLTLLGSTSPRYGSAEEPFKTKGKVAQVIVPHRCEPPSHA